MLGRQNNGREGRRPQQTTRRGLFLAAALVALAFLVLSGLLLVLLPWSPAGLTQLLALIAFALGLASLWGLITLIDSHFDEIERLRGAVLGAQDEAALQPGWRRGGAGGEELNRLAAAVDGLLLRRSLTDSAAEERLAAIVAAAEGGLVAVTDTGLISLANGAAQAAFAHPLTPGTSLFGLVERKAWLAAEAAVREAGGQAEAELPLLDGKVLPVRLTELADHGGHLIALRDLPGVAAPALVQDLSLHDRPPEVVLRDDMPLVNLPGVVMDGETTGLDVTQDRLVSLALLRLHGGRAFPQFALDRLVNPQTSIPRRATAVHGISNHVVAEAPPVAALLPEVRDFIAGKAVIGHNIGFDLALLAAEAARAGLPWTRPPALDTGHLAVALMPSLTDVNLESLAQRYGIEIEGRHTALGDCLLTAAVWRRLLRELEAEGITTFGQARAFARRAERLIRLQRAAGWLVPD